MTDVIPSRRLQDVHSPTEWRPSHNPGSPRNLLTKLQRAEWLDRTNAAFRPSLGGIALGVSVPILAARRVVPAVTRRYSTKTSFAFRASGGGGDPEWSRVKLPTRWDSTWASIRHKLPTPARKITVYSIGGQRQLTHQNGQQHRRQTPHLSVIIASANSPVCGPWAGRPSGKYLRMNPAW